MCFCILIYSLAIDIADYCRSSQEMEHSENYEKMQLDVEVSPPARVPVPYTFISVSGKWLATACKYTVQYVMHCGQVSNC